MAVEIRADVKSQVRQCLGFFQLIHRPTGTKNHLYKSQNIAKLETSFQLW